MTFDGETECLNTTASYNDLVQAMENGFAIFAETGVGGVRYNYIDSCAKHPMTGNYEVRLFNIPYLASATDPTAPLTFCENVG